MHSDGQLFFVVVILIMGLLFVHRFILSVRVYDKAIERTLYDILKSVFLLTFKMLRWLLRKFKS